MFEDAHYWPSRYKPVSFQHLTGPSQEPSNTKQIIVARASPSSPPLLSLPNLSPIPYPPHHPIHAATATLSSSTPSPRCVGGGTYLPDCCRCCGVAGGSGAPDMVAAAAAPPAARTDARPAVGQDAAPPLTLPLLLPVAQAGDGSRPVRPAVAAVAAVSAALVLDELYVELEPLRRCWTAAAAARLA